MGWGIAKLESQMYSIFWLDCKAILSYGLILSICFSIRFASTFWLTFALKLWNLHCCLWTPKVRKWKMFWNQGHNIEYESNLSHKLLFDLLVNWRSISYILLTNVIVNFFFFFGQKMTTISRQYEQISLVSSDSL